MVKVIRHCSFSINSSLEAGVTPLETYRTFGRLVDVNEPYFQTFKLSIPIF